MKDQNKKWLQEYQEFIGSDQQPVPAEQTSAVLKNAGNLLNPNALKVFFKILGIHLITGSLSLAVCHQFGLNPFNTGYSLADWFMSVGGHHFCMLGCGLTFVSLSLLLSGYFLTLEEIAALKRTDMLQNLSLGLISLGIFISFGAEMALGIASLWLLGALIGGFIATTAIWKLKKWSLQ